LAELFRNVLHVTCSCSEIESIVGARNERRWQRWIFFVAPTLYPALSLELFITNTHGREGIVFMIHGFEL
jgi:hypothetical protein